MALWHITLRSSGSSAWLYLNLPPSYWRISRVKGGPNWVREEQYDLNAKLSPDVISRFQGLGDNERDAVVRPMLQSLLASRCGLVVHEEQQPSDVLMLEAGAKVRLSPQVAGEIPKGWIDLGDGARETPVVDGTRRGLKFYNVSLEKLALVLSGFQGEESPLILDRTGLIGRYSFVLFMTDEKQGELDGAGAGNNLQKNWDLSSIGLKLKKGKVMLPIVVIDNIDKPSQN